MPDLTRDEVAAMAAAAGLPMTPEDLPEVTHRLNAFLEALAPLAELPLDGVEPTPFNVAPIPFAPDAEGAG
jgi:Asp-tRNA(Asn)/Glu-tRNA(Gln) amidotransferase C subunit